MLNKSAEKGESNAGSPTIENDIRALLIDIPLRESTNCVLKRLAEQGIASPCGRVESVLSELQEEARSGNSFLPALQRLKYAEPEIFDAFMSTTFEVLGHLDNVMDMLEQMSQGLCSINLNLQRMSDRLRQMSEDMRD